MGALPSREAHEDASSVYFANCDNTIVVHIPLTTHFFASPQCLAFRQLHSSRNHQSALYGFDVQDLRPYMLPAAAEAFARAQHEDWGDEVREPDASVHYYDADTVPPSCRQPHAALSSAAALYDAVVTTPTAGQLCETNADMCALYAQEQRWRAALRRRIRRTRAQGTHATAAAATTHACATSCVDGDDEDVQPPARFVRPLPMAIAVRLTRAEEVAARRAYRRRHGSDGGNSSSNRHHRSGDDDDDDSETNDKAQRARVAHCVRRRRRYRFEREARYKDGRLHLVEEDGVLYLFAYRHHCGVCAPHTPHTSTQASRNGGDGEDDGGRAAASSSAYVTERCTHHVVCQRSGERGGHCVECMAYIPDTLHSNTPDAATTIATASSCQQQQQHNSDGLHRVYTFPAAAQCAQCGDGVMAAAAERCVDEHNGGSGSGSDEGEFVIPVTAVRVVGMHGLLPARTRGTPWLRGVRDTGNDNNDDDDDDDADVCDACLDAYVEQLPHRPPVLRLCRFIDGATPEKLLNRTALVTLLTYRASCLRAGLPCVLVRPMWATCVLSNIPFLQMVRETFLRAKAALAEVEDGNVRMRRWLERADGENNFWRYINANLHVLVKEEEEEEEDEEEDDENGSGAMSTIATTTRAETTATPQQQQQQQRHEACDDDDRRKDNATGVKASYGGRRGGGASVGRVLTAATVQAPARIGRPEGDGARDVLQARSSKKKATRHASNVADEESKDDKDDDDDDAVVVDAAPDLLSSPRAATTTTTAAAATAATSTTATATTRASRPDFTLYSSRLEPLALERSLCAALERGPRESDVELCTRLARYVQSQLQQQQQQQRNDTRMSAQRRALLECGMMCVPRGRQLLFRMRGDCMRALCDYCAQAAAPLFIGAYIEPVDCTTVSYGGAVRLSQTVMHKDDCSNSRDAAAAAAVSSLWVRIDCPPDVQLIAEYAAKGLLTAFSVSDCSRGARGPSAQHSLVKYALLPHKTRCATTSSSSSNDDDDDVMLAQQQRSELRAHGHVYTYAAREFCDGDLVVYDCTHRRWQHYEHAQLRRRVAVIDDDDDNSDSASATRQPMYRAVPQATATATTTTTTVCCDTSNGCHSEAAHAAVATSSLSASSPPWTRLLFVGINELLLSWTKWVVDNRFYDDRHDAGWLHVRRGGGHGSVDDKSSTSSRPQRQRLRDSDNDEEDEDSSSDSSSSGGGSSNDDDTVDNMSSHNSSTSSSRSNSSSSSSTHSHCSHDSSRSNSKTRRHVQQQQHRRHRRRRQLPCTRDVATLTTTAVTAAAAAAAAAANDTTGTRERQEQQRRLHKDEKDDDDDDDVSATAGDTLVRVGRYHIWSFRLNTQRYFYGVIPRFTRVRRRRRGKPQPRARHRRKTATAATAVTAATNNNNNNNKRSTMSEEGAAASALRGGRRRGGRRRPVLSQQQQQQQQVCAVCDADDKDSSGSNIITLTRISSPLPTRALQQQQPLPSPSLPPPPPPLMMTTMSSSAPDTRADFLAYDDDDAASSVTTTTTTMTTMTTAAAAMRTPLLPMWQAQQPQTATRAASYARVYSDASPAEAAATAHAVPAMMLCSPPPPQQQQQQPQVPLSPLASSVNSVASLLTASFARERTSYYRNDANTFIQDNKRWENEYYPPLPAATVHHLLSALRAHGYTDSNLGEAAAQLYGSTTSHHNVRDGDAVSGSSSSSSRRGGRDRIQRVTVRIRRKLSADSVRSVVTSTTLTVIDDGGASSNSDKNTSECHGNRPRDANAQQVQLEQQQQQQQRNSASHDVDVAAAVAESRPGRPFHWDAYT